VDFDLRQAREILVRTPLVLRRWLAGLSEEWTQSNYGPDTFSPVDVLGHLIHGETSDWIPRARMILEHGEARAFEPFDRYAQFEDSRGKSAAALLDEFEEARTASLRALDALMITPEMLGRRGRHPALGPVTLGQLLATWTAHDLNHLAQIARCMATQYADAAGPWREYLSVLTPPPTRMDADGARRRAAAMPAAGNHSPQVGVFAAPTPYAPRPIRFRGVRSVDAWRLKEYAITFADGRLHEADFATGVRCALEELPARAVTAVRPGVGMLILHAGQGASYVVLGWWDNQNELPLRVVVRGDDEAAWRPAGSHESICVWDLEILTFERQAYVETVLAARGSPADYLGRHFERRIGTGSV
jgi:hypothetical protein